MSCAVGQCPRPANGVYTWGMYPDGGHTEAALCEDHARELWDQARGPVTLGLMHFQIAPLAQSVLRSGANDS